MRLTLNGLSQGFAADRAWEALAALGVRTALVDAGEWRAAGQPGASACAGAPGLADIALQDAAASSGIDGFRFSADGGGCAPHPGSAHQPVALTRGRALMRPASSRCLLLVLGHGARL